MIDMVMKSKVLSFLARTLKATTAMVGAATAVASASFVPEPYDKWAAGAVIVLTWIATYFVPYVTKLVESTPDDWWPEEDHQPTAPVPTVVEPDMIEDPFPETSPITAIDIDTAGIHVIEGADARPVGTRVDDILDRLRAEGSPSVF